MGQNIVFIPEGNCMFLSIPRLRYFLCEWVVTLLCLEIEENNGRVLLELRGIDSSSRAMSCNKRSERQTIRCSQRMKSYEFKEKVSEARLVRETSIEQECRIREMTWHILITGINSYRNYRRFKIPFSNMKPFTSGRGHYISYSQSTIIVGLTFHYTLPLFSSTSRHRSATTHSHKYWETYNSLQG